MNVDIKLGKFNSKSLGFVDRKELWDTDGNERGFIRVLELPVHVLNFCFELVERLEQLLLLILLTQLLGPSPHKAGNLRHHASELFFHLYEFYESLLDNIREIQKA